MLTYYINQRDNLPIYEYLAKSIREDIKSGKIKPGEKLPSKRSFAKHLNISIITVENAYNQLIMEGYVEPKEKVGYFVVEMEEIKNYRKPINSIHATLEINEHQFFANFSSNKINYNLFPRGVWAKIMRSVIALNDTRFLMTTPHNGISYLRYSITSYLHEFRNINVSPDQVVIGCGVEYLYNRLMQMVASQNRVLGLEDPGNHKFARIAELYNVPCRYIPVNNDGISVEKLKGLDVNVVQVSPANQFPTGVVMTIKRRRELLKWAYEEDNRYIIEDDYDSEIRTSGTMIPPISSNTENDRVIYINSFSKSISPSLRISYMVLPKSLLELYRSTAIFYSCTVPSADQYYLAEFISRGYYEKHLNRLRKYYSDAKQIIMEELKKTELYKISEIIDNYTGTAFVMKVNSKISKKEVIERAIKEDVYFSFLNEYSHEKFDNENYIVLNYASIDKKRIPEAIQRLSRAFCK